MSNLYTCGVILLGTGEGDTRGRWHKLITESRFHIKVDAADVNDNHGDVNESHEDDSDATDFDEDVL